MKPNIYIDNQRLTKDFLIEGKINEELLVQVYVDFYGWGHHHT